MRTFEGSFWDLPKEFIDYEVVYRDAIRKGNTRESEAEIARGIEEAKKAFELAYHTVFRHATEPFNPERFQSLTGCGLTLEDMRVWLEDYLKSQGRKLDAVCRLAHSLVFGCFGGSKSVLRQLSNRLSQGSAAVLGTKGGLRRFLPFGEDCRDLSRFLLALSDSARGLLWLCWVRFCFPCFGVGGNAFFGERVLSSGSSRFVGL